MTRGCSAFAVWGGEGTNRGTRQVRAPPSLTSSLTERSPLGKVGFSVPAISSYLARARSSLKGPLHSTRRTCDRCLLRTASKRTSFRSRCTCAQVPWHSSTTCQTPTWCPAARAPSCQQHPCRRATSQDRAAAPCPQRAVPPPPRPWLCSAGRWRPYPQTRPAPRLPVAVCGSQCGLSWELDRPVTRSAAQQEVAWNRYSSRAKEGGAQRQRLTFLSSSAVCPTEAGMLAPHFTCRTTPSSAGVGGVWPPSEPCRSWAGPWMDSNGLCRVPGVAWNQGASK